MAKPVGTVWAARTFVEKPMNSKIPTALKVAYVIIGGPLIIAPAVLAGFAYDKITALGHIGEIGRAFAIADREWPRAMRGEPYRPPSTDAGNAKAQYDTSRPDPGTSGLNMSGPNFTPHPSPAPPPAPPPPPPNYSDGDGSQQYRPPEGPTPQQGTPGQPNSTGPSGTPEYRAPETPPPPGGEPGSLNYTSPSGAPEFRLLSAMGQNSAGAPTPYSPPTPSTSPQAKGWDPGFDPSDSDEPDFDDVPDAGGPIHGSGSFQSPAQAGALNSIPGFAIAAPVMTPFNPSSSPVGSAGPTPWSTEDDSDADNIDPDFDDDGSSNTQSGSGTPSATGSNSSWSTGSNVNTGSGTGDGSESMSEGD